MKKNISYLRLINGDSREEIKKIESNSFDLIILDPPYIVTKAKWDQNDIIEQEFIKEIHRVLKDTGSLYVFCGIGEKSQSLIRWFPLFSEQLIFKDMITWKKQRGIGMRRGWLYTREEIMWFVKDNKKFVWNKENQYSNERRAFDIKKKGGAMVNRSKYKRLTNVWTDIFEVGYGSSPQKYNMVRSKLAHFTPKPVELIKRIILAHTKDGDTILDPFLGTGSTAIAALDIRRSFTGIELDKETLKSAEKRINEFENRENNLALF